MTGNDSSFVASCFFKKATNEKKMIIYVCMMRLSWNKSCLRKNCKRQNNYLGSKNIKMFMFYIINSLIYAYKMVWTILNESNENPPSSNVYFNSSMKLNVRKPVSDNVTDNYIN